MDTPIDPAELRNLAVATGVQAAALVRSRGADGRRVAQTKSSDVDVVTATDRESEELIRALISAARPDDAISGEEEGSAGGTSGVRWIVDPIDGTVNFIYGLPEHAVSIAAEVDGVVVAGAVVNVVHDTVYAAALGQGATRNGEPIAVRPPTSLATSLVLTGFGYDAAVRAQQGACVAALLPLVRDIRRMGSCALDLCHVAEGAADAYLEEGTQEWDHAAGALIAREAGARVELLPGAGGRPIVVAAVADSFDEFCATARRCGFVT